MRHQCLDQVQQFGDLGLSLRIDGEVRLGARVGDRTGGSGKS